MNQEQIKEIAEALINLKHELIATYLLALCISVLTIYLFTRIKKSAELREINNNFGPLLNQQEKLTEVTEKIKQSLDKESIHYQIRLNAYHEKSIESITEIYEKIIHVRDSAKDLSFNQDENEKQKFRRTVSEFRHTFDIRKIWIPKKLSEHIENIAIEIDRRTHKFIQANTKLKFIKNLPPEKIDEIFKDEDDFYNYINQEILFVFNDLVDRIGESVNT